jgi:hypothetical protein
VQGFLFFVCLFVFLFVGHFFFLLSTSKLFVVVVRKAVSEESAEERNGVSLLHMTVYNIASENAHGKTVKFVLEGFVGFSEFGFPFFCFLLFPCKKRRRPGKEGEGFVMDEEASGRVERIAGRRRWSWKGAREPSDGYGVVVVIV